MLSSNFVRYALQIGAIELVPEGRELRKKRMSPYFFNSGLFTTAAALKALAAEYGTIIVRAILEGKIPTPNVLFGPAYKGIPLSVAVTLHLSTVYIPLRDTVEYAFNRKETKDHGEGGDIVGAKLQDKHVLIVDDVMSTGSSSGGAVAQVCAAGGTPIACAIAFDRMERGVDTDLSATQAFTKHYGIPVLSAVTLDDLVSALTEHPDIPYAKETLPKILAYREQYGVAA